jgi:hypothetical protein
MNSAWPGFVSAIVAVLFASGHSLASSVESASPLTADEVIQRMLARSQQREKGAETGDYTYTRLTVTEELDASGKVKERKEKTHQVFCREGVTSEKVLTVNGRPQTEGESRKPPHQEGESRENERGSKRRHTDNRENYLTPEIVERFDFSLVGEQTLNGRPSYQIAFAPKLPALPAYHTVDRVLNRISGTVWVDAEEFEIAKAEFSLGSEVQFLAGVIGCLKKLSFTMTRTRMSGGFWLNTSSVVDFEGRKLFSPIRVKTHSQCNDFHPLRLSG